MPSNFRITPPAPEAVSGLSLIDQIENAVNELGGQYDELETEVGSKVDQALQASQNAEATANSALQTAQDAETLANEAKTEAGSALIAASQAQTRAEAASVKADAAYDQSTLALTDSQVALSNSQAALEQSETALEQSTEARQAAESAQTSSQAALEAASQAVGNFILDEEPCDADTFFQTPQKKYLTNSGSSHFPGDLTFPAYFEIMTSSDDLSVTQKCWGTDASLVYARSGLIDHNEPENPTVIWEAWKTSSSQSQTGVINYFAMTSPPLGWLECNGAELGRAAYSNLFSIIGTAFGEGDGSNTFNLPDLRGEFIRGWDNDRGVDIGRVFGSSQTDSFSSHRHYLATLATSVNYALGSTMAFAYSAASGRYTDYVGGPETRPRNLALLPCIKY